MLKKYIKKIIGNLYNKYTFHEQKNIIFIKNIQWLTPLLQGWQYIPVTNWAADPTFYAHVCNDIIINRRKNIIEFGSGISTILLSRLAKLNKLNINFLSIDEDNKWQEIVSDTLKNDNTQDAVSLIYSPVKQNTNGQFWYSAEFISEQIKNNIDCVIVDGPKGNNHLARFGAIPFLMDVMSNDYSVFLHDTDRQDERVILEKWQALLTGSTLTTYYRYGTIHKGTSFCSVPQSV